MVWWRMEETRSLIAVGFDDVLAFAKGYCNPLASPIAWRRMWVGGGCSSRSLRGEHGWLLGGTGERMGS